MSWSIIAHEDVGSSILTQHDRSLTDAEKATLLRLFGRIAQHWKFKISPTQIEPFARDLIEARSVSIPSYRPEYLNAAMLYQAMEAEAALDKDKVIFTDTIVEDGSAATTRLQHMKWYVVNEFITCFVALGGFKDFGGRNYKGFMGGSRFGDTPPVRT
ncbi:MAG: hypothetical protein ABL908_10100 [Hyphomicrobium sp.]